jgi:hypothetical protein
VHGAPPGEHTKGRTEVYVLVEVALVVVVYIKVEVPIVMVVVVDVWVTCMRKLLVKWMMYKDGVEQDCEKRINMVSGIRYAWIWMAYTKYNRR